VSLLLVIQDDIEPVQSSNKHNSRIFGVPAVSDPTFVSLFTFAAVFGLAAYFFVVLFTTGFVTAFAVVVALSGAVFASFAMVFLTGLVEVLGVSVDVFLVI
jgi:hypothetical protein